MKLLRFYRQYRAYGYGCVDALRFAWRKTHYA